MLKIVKLYLILLFTWFINCPTFVLIVCLCYLVEEDLKQKAILDDKTDEEKKESEEKDKEDSE